MDGKGIVIGIGDTGLDYKNTYFYDKDHSVRFSKSRLDKKHRKIALYVPIADKKEGTTAGHGTHVCGIAAGKKSSGEGNTFEVVFGELAYP